MHRRDAVVAHDDRDCNQVQLIHTNHVHVQGLVPQYTHLAAQRSGILALLQSEECAALWRADGEDEEVTAEQVDSLLQAGGGYEATLVAVRRLVRVRTQLLMFDELCPLVKKLVAGELHTPPRGPSPDVLLRAAVAEPEPASITREHKRLALVRYLCSDDCQLFSNLAANRIVLGGDVLVSTSAHACSFARSTYTHPAS